MPKPLPEYIHPKKLEWCGVEPPSTTRTDVLLGIYYNVLFPQERDAEARKKLYAWISAQDPLAPFPLNDDELCLLSAATCTGMAIKALTGQFAQKLKTQLDNGFSFTDAVHCACSELENEASPVYLAMGQLFSKKKTMSDAVKTRYTMLSQSFMQCGSKPKEKLLSYSIQKYKDVKDNKEKLNFLLLGSIEKGKGQILRKNDYWKERQKPMIQMIKETCFSFANIPFFLALQEVTPVSLEVLKKDFSNIHWVSFNNISGAETTLISPANETQIGESGSHTATIGLSPELQVQRVKLGYLPNCSQTPRTILGVEVLNTKTGGNFAIFSIHTDYLIQKELYTHTATVIQEFIKEFTRDGALPFICGGDLNVFEGLKGAEYVDLLKSKSPLLYAHDYREGPFYAPKEILNATFIGHVRDDYKMALDADANVEPNALDHILLTLKTVFGFRKAGVYDNDTGILIDPIAEPMKFKDNLKKRNTTSDHFMNGVLVVSL